VGSDKWIFQGYSSSTSNYCSHGRGLVSHADNEYLASIRLPYEPKEGAAEEFSRTGGCNTTLLFLLVALLEG